MPMFSILAHKAGESAALYITLAYAFAPNPQILVTYDKQPENLTGHTLIR